MRQARPGVPALCGGIGLAVLLLGIATPSLWLDEAASWSYARRPLDDLLATTLGSSNAVELVYYVLLHFWIGVAGDSELALRLPSAVAMAVAVWAVSRTAEEIAGARTALFAGLAMVALPGVVHFGQEARPYAFVVAAIAISTLLLHRALTRDGRAWWAGYAVALVAVGYFHLLSLLVVAGQFVALLILRRDLWRPFVAAVAAAAAAVLPIAILGFAQRGQIAWIPPVQTEWLWTGPSLITGSLAATACLALLVLIGGAGDRRLTALGVPTALAIPILLWSIGHVAPLFLARYLIGAAPGIALAAGGSLGAMRPLKALAAAALLVALVVPQQLALREPAGHNQDFRGAADLVATDCTARILYDGQAREPMSYYLARRDCAPSETAEGVALWVVQVSGSQISVDGYTLLRRERFGSALVSYWVAEAQNSGPD